MTRIRLRIALLVLGVVGLIAGITTYFSSEAIPLCGVSGAPRWKAPAKGEHRLLVVLADRAACFFDVDDDHRLVGELGLHGISGIDGVEVRGGRVAIRYGNGRGAFVDLASGRTSPTEPPSAFPDELTLAGPGGWSYETHRGRLGFAFSRSGASGPIRGLAAFEGFSWNQGKFGDERATTGLVLEPGGNRLWVLDAPNSFVHLFRVGTGRPRLLADVQLQKPLSGGRFPCSGNCRRVGSLLLSEGGRYLYVGDSGDVIDTRKEDAVTNLEALHNSRVTLLVDWVDGRPAIASRR